MKLRYYLRGLGIGMLVAALVLILSGNTGGRMSDEAVKRRAAELGMVEKEKTVLGEIGGDESSGEEESEAAETPLAEAGAVSAEEDEQTGAPDGQGEEAGAEGEEPQAAESAGIEDASDTAQEEAQQENGEDTPANPVEERADEVAQRAEEVAENSASVNTVTFEVHQGDSSVIVARRAQELGLVASAAEFDAFLCQNGYDKRISIGKYEITPGVSQKEIADIVTKKQVRNF